MRRAFGLLLLGAIVLCLSSGVAWARFEPVTCGNNAFTVEQEVAEGNKVAAQVYRQMPVLPDSDPVSRYVQNLGARLVQFAPPSPGTHERWPFNFHVVASEEINAFALPGGTMFVNLGTVQAAETEAQLAGVMAHEMSHVIMRHSTCNLSRQRKRSVLYGLGAVGSAIVLGNGGLGSMAQTGIGAAQGLDFLHMSRDYEKQADLLGVTILYDAGYDPRGLPQFFETISAKYGQGGAQMLSDHPNPGNRTEYVNAEIATFAPRTGQTVTSAAFKTARAEAQSKKVYSAKEVQSGVWRGTGLYAAGPGEGGGMASVSDSGQGVAGQTGGGQSPAAAEPAPALHRAQLGLGDTMTTVQGPKFRINAPQSWEQSRDAQGGVTVAPNGGYGSFGLAYGALVELAPVKGNGAQDRDSLVEATKVLLQQLLQGSAGLTQAGQITARQVNGREANTVDLKGSSPVRENGKDLPERDWLVTIARSDGDLSYIVFTAPERDFAMLTPTFEAMLASFEAQ